MCDSTNPSRWKLETEMNGTKQEAAMSLSSERVKAYFELTKPRISLLLLIVAVAAYFIAANGQVSWFGFAMMVLSVACLASGIFTLNHYMERDRDALMVRTRKRPLPSGRLLPVHALRFGIVLTTVSFVISGVFINLLSMALYVFVAVSYLLVYTPLKYKTPFHTALGALSGAMPPLIGWAAATGGLPIDAWILAGVLFLWQFPHFLSIDMIYKEDYEKAGILVLPVVDKTGVQTALQVIVALVALIAVSILPIFTGLAKLPYVVGASVLGLVFLVAGIRAVATREKMHAKHLLRASVLYLPLLFIFLIINP